MNQSFVAAGAVAEGPYFKGPTTVRFITGPPSATVWAAWVRTIRQLVNALRRLATWMLEPP